MKVEVWEFVMEKGISKTIIEMVKNVYKSDLEMTQTKGKKFFITSTLSFIEIEQVVTGLKLDE